MSLCSNEVHVINLTPSYKGGMNTLLISETKEYTRGLLSLSLREPDNEMFTNLTKEVGEMVNETVTVS